MAPEKEVESRLQRLDRHNLWMWGLAALLLAALGLAVVALTLSENPGDVAERLPAVGTRPVLVGGLCALVALFCLYVLIKQSQMQHLRAELFRAQLGEEVLRSRLAGLSSLFEGMTQVGMQIDLDAVLETLTDHVRSAIGAEESSIMLIEDPPGELRCRAVSGRDAGFIRDARVRLGEGVSGWVAQHRQPLVLDPREMKRRFPSELKPGRSIATALCVPLVARTDVIGVLNVSRQDGGPPFTSEDARLLTVFGAHIAIAIRGITDRAQEAEVRQSQKMEALGRLAGGVAHDFNNLLTVILTYSTNLIRGLEAPGPMREGVEKIRDAAERCASLSKQLLAFSRKQVLELSVLDLNTIVRGMIRLLERVIGEDIELVVMLDPGLRRVKADRTQIEQVMMNLALNARDAMPQGGCLTIETANVELGSDRSNGSGSSNPQVMLKVSDTGLGMEAETLAHIFEPFFTTKEQGKGTGLGLATVYAIVKQNEGHIEVASEPRRGTTFRVYWPGVLDRVRPVDGEADLDGSEGGRETVLVAEDEEAVRALVREILEGAGYTVLEAPDGPHALAIAEEHRDPIHLLLTDVVMPGMNGRELARQLRARRPELIILCMSGYTGDTAADPGMESGSGFLQKPFTPDRLLTTVRNALRSSPLAAA
ncbi:MAG TPA: response regulator [Candidatus Eisenbacteria bacterium]|jgi:signal transduction histidine kinase/CheY-like chemotaxis protein